MTENTDLPAEKRDKTERLQNAGILCAIIVSVSSFSLAIWQAQETWRLNRLSVKPIISVEWHGSLGQSGSGLSISNTGLGPALITSVDLNYRDREIPSIYEELRDLLFNEFKLPDAKISYQIWSGGFWVKAGETTNLLQLSPIESATIEELDQLMDFTYHINVHIEYESIYGKKSVSHRESDNAGPDFPRNIVE